jgi:hypothetical protein
MGRMKKWKASWAKAWGKKTAESVNNCDRLVETIRPHNLDNFCKSMTSMDHKDFRKRNAER